YPGKGFALVEGFAVAIVAAMIARFELGRAVELARQKPARQRQPRQNADLLGAGLLKKELGGTLPKQVVDDLHRSDAGVFDGLERFFDSLDADSIVTQLAALLELVQSIEDLWHVVNIRRRTV